jgi:SAM-dependent methyltransferase
MKRELEPEVMDDPAQAVAYAQADFAGVNQGFVDRFLALTPLAQGDVVDLGCGPADILIRLAAARPALRCVGIDASLPMLGHAGRDVRARGAVASLLPTAARLGALPFADGSFDAVVSNSLLHHLPEPRLFWDEVRRLARPKATVLVMDLHRPATADGARGIVETYARDEPEILRRDFYHSLLAAFTLDEVREQLRAGALELGCELVSDRHWAAYGRL